MKRKVFRGAAFLTALVLLMTVATAQAAEEANTLPLTVEEEGALPLEAGETEIFEEQPVVPEQVGGFSEGMIRVTDGTLWGYANAGGTVVIPLQFEMVSDFFLGSAQVTKDGKKGLLCWDGTYFLQPIYDELTDVGCGLYLARHDGVWDLISIAGENQTAQCIYSDLVSATLTSGTNGVLTLQGQDGTVKRISLRTLPQLLKEEKVPGWQFPLHTGKQAAFSDVSGLAWYDRWVNLAYSADIVDGIGGGLFAPGNTLSVAETLRLAACMESLARQDDFHLQEISGVPWYKSSVVYCEASGVIRYGEYGQEDLERAVTRAEMAKIFSKTTAVRSIAEINDPVRVRNAVPDVAAQDFAADAIYALYAKGILTGVDAAYTFLGDANLTRAEVAAVVARIARPEHRITLW